MSQKYSRIFNIITPVHLPGQLKLSFRYPNDAIYLWGSIANYCKKISLYILEILLKKTYFIYVNYNNGLLK